MKTCQQCGRELNIDESNSCVLCKEMEILASKAIAAQYEAVKFARELAADGFETKETVGDWNGLEEQAANAMNQIYNALVEAVEITSASKATPIHPDVIELIFATAQEQWLQDKELLFLTKEDMRNYAMFFFKKFV